MSKSLMATSLISFCVTFGIEFYALIHLWRFAENVIVSIGLVLLFSWALEGHLRIFFKCVTVYNRSYEK